MEPRKTPLYQIHLKYGGRMIEFGGWSLPVQYTGIIEEHKAVRERAGVFDVSHMGEIEVRGSDAEALVQKAVTNDISRLPINRVMYTPLCNPDGGVIDDLLVYRLGEQRYLLVVNAANTDKDYRWLSEMAGRFRDVLVEDVSANLAQLAIQGPLAQAILQRLTPVDLRSIRYYWCQQDVNIVGVKCLLSRTGYTGEDGFEIYCEPSKATELWEQLLEAGEEEGLAPAGLGARDTLRFEASMPLYGHELDDNTTPLEAGLSTFVRLDKGDFVGREALVRQFREGVPQKLVGFEMLERGIPRTGYIIVKGDREVGRVTSGCYAPTLNAYLGMGYVATEHSQPGTELGVVVRSKQLKAKIVKMPFYRRPV